MKLLNIWLSSFNKCCVTKVFDDTDDDILYDNSYFDNHNLKSDLSNLWIETVLLDAQERRADRRIHVIEVFSFALSCAY
jgi:hypothetical protein